MMMNARAKLEHDLPSISIIIATYNCGTALCECLKSIANQDYPKDKLEILVVDGGSTDSTVEVAKSFNAKVIVKKQDRQNPERRKALGLLNAKNELIVYIDSDNILPHHKWFLSMVQPLLENEKIIATQPLRYAYKKSYSLLNRYFALFGVSDPVAYYLDKRDRLSQIESSWRHVGDAKDMGNYYLVVFKPENMPTLGANGFVIRKDILLKAKCNPSEFFHIDVNYDLVKLGYNRYGMVKDSIVHLTGNTFLSFLRRRMVYMKQYYILRQSARRYRIYIPAHDKRKLVAFIFNSLTLKTVCDSVKGYKKIQDTAWFLHPIMCISILIIYGSSIVEWHLKSLIASLIRDTGIQIG